jgi:hypothetical protein
MGTDYYSVEVILCAQWERTCGNILIGLFFPVLCFCPSDPCRVSSNFTSLLQGELVHSGLSPLSPKGNSVGILFIFLRHSQIRPYLDPTRNARKCLTLLSA